MYFIYALIAALGYGLQNTLMASFYRKMDPLSAVAYRGLSLGLSMAPLLLFAPYSQLINITHYSHYIVFAAILAALGNWCAANAFIYLSVGVATSICVSFALIITTVIGYFSFDESLSIAQLIFMSLVLLGILLLGLNSSEENTKRKYNTKKGVAFSFLYGIFLGSAFSIIGGLSRELHPFISGYFWEFTIGIISFIFALARKPLVGKGLAPIRLNDFLKILAYSSPTALGTGLYALAMSNGPIAIATAIVSTQMIFASIIAFLLYGERLKYKQIVCIIGTCLMIIGLKLSTAI